MISLYPLLLALSVASTPAPEASVDGDCPTPARQLPRYPAEVMRKNISGTTVVKATIDSCGRVVDPRVVDSSGHAVLDRIAIDTVRSWVLNEQERRQVGDGEVNLPVRFGGVRSVTPQRVDWPRTHRRPVYLPDEQSIGFTSIEAYREGRPGRNEPMLQSPYALVMQKSGASTRTSFQQDRDDAMTYWLDYLVQDPPAAGAPSTSGASIRTIAVARYRLLVENGRPVVRVAMLCEEAPEACKELEDFLLEGLPIAKPPRS